MIRLTRSTLSACLPLFVLAASAQADTIYRTTEEAIEDVTIVEETISSVIYKKDRGREEAVPSDTVLEVVYSKLPKDVDEAETLLIDGDLSGALELFQYYVERRAEKPESKYKWAPAYAARRAIDIHMTMGNMEGVRTAADTLIEKFPESRFVPDAYLAKANAEFWNNKPAAARQTLQSFQGLVDSKGLAERWRLECELGLVLTDDKLGASDRSSKLQKISGDAGDEYPVVRNRALVALGESLLAEAASAPSKLSEAQEVFQRIVDDPKADPATLAGAYTGLGDALYQFVPRGGETDESRAERLTRAAKSYMRVVVVYKDQSRYVGKAMFYAARCFDLIDGNKTRAIKLYRAVRRTYPDSKWATEAGKFM